MESGEAEHGDGDEQLERAEEEPGEQQQQRARRVVEREGREDLNVS